MQGEQIQDPRIRLMAFDWLTEQVGLQGEVLPRSLLSEGFLVNDMRVSLLGPQGIWKPKAISGLPLSITTVAGGPYDDTFSHEGLLLYRYRGTDIHHRDNVGLRESMERQVPLIYFHGMIKGRYLPVWPVFVVSDSPEKLTFTVAVDDMRSIGSEVASTWGAQLVAEDIANARRIYITSTVKQRLHQSSFRERVLQAYREQCSLCRLRHIELLDAAHIIPDSEPGGAPVISNGIALCKLHHAAFDRYFLGIRSDYKIEIREDILDETDGPMLQHGLKELHGKSIVIPRASELRPDPELLERRYQKFRDAS